MSHFCNTSASHMMHFLPCKVPRSRLFLLGVICIFIFILLVFSSSYANEIPPENHGVFGAQSFTLENGLRVIVVENHRAPVVTHMLWIGAGAADEPESLSGAAHFLEHLMFKGTPKTPPGAYSKMLHAVGGDDNAFTSHDYTAYFATLPSAQLPLLMGLERDRFLNLAVPPAHVASEKQVVIEERRQRTENDPLGPFYEQINAYLMAGTPYDKPIIGWMSDIEKLTEPDVMTFKKTWYHPGNMILILSGDVTYAQAQDLAATYYADLPAEPIPDHRRRQPPAFPAPLTLTWTSDKIAQSQLVLAWRMPSYAQDARTARTLDVLHEILDGGAATRLYQDLVVRDKLATQISFDYDGHTRDGSALWVTATPAPKVPLAKLDHAVRAVLAQAARTLTEQERTEALARIERQSAFARDSVAGPAMMIGQALVTGQTLDEVEAAPALLSGVTLEDLTSLLSNRIACPAAGPGCVLPLTAYITAKKPAAGAPAPSLTPSTLTGPHS